MKITDKKQFVQDAIVLLYIVLFIYAASSKYLDYVKFRIELEKSPLLSNFGALIAWSIPLIEIGLAIMLMNIKTRLLGLYGCFTLMVAFTAYIIAILNFAEYIPCSCGGILENMSWNQHLVFNILFMGLGAVAILFHPVQTKNPMIKTLLQ